jgi:co-chaperonin GroES (HSP10)
MKLKPTNDLLLVKVVEDDSGEFEVPEEEKKYFKAEVVALDTKSKLCKDLSVGDKIMYLKSGNDYSFGDGNQIIEFFQVIGTIEDE